MAQETVRITRIDRDGSTVAGTATIERDGRAIVAAGDPVDLGGTPMSCPVGSRIMIHLSSLHHLTGEVPAVRG